MPTAPVDISNLPTSEAHAQLGELLALCLKSRGAGVFLMKESGEITIIDPSVLDNVSDDDMAFHLLEAWSEDEIEQYLTARTRRLSQ